MNRIERIMELVTDEEMLMVIEGKGAIADMLLKIRWELMDIKERYNDVEKE